VCESGISDRTKLHYVSPTVRSWEGKQLKLILEDDVFNK